MEYQMEEALKEEERLLGSDEKAARAGLLFDGNAEFADRLDAVITDLMGGHHVSQAKNDTSINELIDLLKDIDEEDIDDNPQNK